MAVVGYRSEALQCSLQPGRGGLRWRAPCGNLPLRKVSDGDIRSAVFNALLGVAPRLEKGGDQVISLNY